MKISAVFVWTALIAAVGAVHLSAQTMAATAETGPPNASGQSPAFAGQTRAPAAAATPVQVETIVDGLDHPWALEFLPDGRMLVTEKAGVMLIIGADGNGRTEMSGLPSVDNRGQGGLLDVAISPDFANDQRIYFSFAEPRADGNGTTLARGRLEEGRNSARLEDLQIIFRQVPSWQSTKHFGSRIVFAPDGTLYLTLGERSLPEPRKQAQQLDSDLGKVVRIDPDGSVPSDNPFVGQAGARPEIWSYGHRNIQAATLDDEGRLWTVEHGPRGGDELNRPEAGKNCGWPIITYGIDYSGEPIGAGITAKAGMEQPVYYWDPVIAPSGMTYYDGEQFPEWRGDFLIGGLVSRGIVRLVMTDGRVSGEERIDLGARIRDVKVGPDDAVYALTDGSDGRILKILPKD